MQRKPPILLDQERRIGPPAGDAGTMRAWERFLTGEPGAAIPLGHFVASSWRRSLAFGVDPSGHLAPLTEGDAVEALRDHHHDLLAAANAIFIQAAGLFAGSRSMLLLTDPDGVVLRAAGDRQTLREGERIHLMVGGHWNESVIGTNGIGAAIATGHPAQVHAAEHFCEGIKSWTCAASPIHDPVSNALLGIVDISGPPSTYQRNNLMLAVATARQIEAVLAERASFERATLLEACLRRRPRAGSAMLVIDRAGRVVFTSGQAGALDQRLEGLDAGLPPEAWHGRLSKQLRVDGFDPVVLDGRPIGAMLILQDRPGLSGLHRNAQDRRQPEAASSRGGFTSIIGGSPAMLAAIARAKQLSGPLVPVLIEGETGTGKELLARAIHAEARPHAPFIVFDCGAASRELIGAELFGHVRGAFTGATAEGRPGRFELADGGTLCLDEIGELPLDLQPILLRALEEGVVCRLGDTTPRQVSVRLLAMTNRNLREEVAAGRFRADLFYRVNVTAIRLPPLRERTGDIDRLAAHFVRLLALRHGVPVRNFDAGAMAALRGHSWPGNVRELRNLVEGLLLADDDGPVTLAELPPELREASTPAPAAAPARLDDVEQETVRRAIREARGNMASAARRLGISRSTLYRMLKRRDEKAGLFRSDVCAVDQQGQKAR